MRILKDQKGVASLVITLMVLSVMLLLMISIYVAAFYEQEAARNTVNSYQAYYAAESGLEDMILRLREDWPRANPNTIIIGEGGATVSVSNISDGARIISAKGSSGGSARRVEMVEEMITDSISFFYGAHAGIGGLILENGSDIIGEVYSNGDAEIRNTSSVIGSIKVALNGASLAGGGSVSGDAYVDYCENVNIGGTLYYNSQFGCSAASTTSPLASEIATASLPISSEKINSWKQEALDGDVYSGDLVIGGWDSEVLGPALITGDLLLSGHGVLEMNGTLWVSGQVRISDQAEIKLSPDYDTKSGLVISDGPMSLEDSGKGNGSGGIGSYLGFISTYASGTAISIMDSFDADILYANNEEVLIENTSNLKEVSGYRLHLANNAELVYETELENVAFVGGPHGSWIVKSWKEVE